MNPRLVSEYKAAMQEVLPNQPDIKYVEAAAKMPYDLRSMMPMRLTDLGWAPWCTTKPPPFTTTAVKLCDEYLTHGFESALGPILICLREGSRDYLCECVGYVKGMARICTLHALLHYMWSTKVPIVGTKLAQSCSTTWARKGALHPNLLQWHLRMPS